jgi:hypothetical protein
MGRAGPSSRCLEPLHGCRWRKTGGPGHWTRHHHGDPCISSKARAISDFCACAAASHNDDATQNHQPPNKFMMMTGGIKKKIKSKEKKETRQGRASPCPRAHTRLQTSKKEAEAASEEASTARCRLSSSTAPCPCGARPPPASRLLRRRRSPSPPIAASSYALLHARPFSPRPAQAEVTPAEARRLVRLVAVEALKRRLRDGRDEVVGYGELLDACGGRRGTHPRRCRGARAGHG